MCSVTQVGTGEAMAFLPSRETISYSLVTKVSSLSPGAEWRRVGAWRVPPRAHRVPGGPAATRPGCSAGWPPGLLVTVSQDKAL